MKDIFYFIIKYKEAIIITLIILFSALTHGYNMFGYPYFENDEGTYMSQAWSITNTGELAPYTYWYDHAPGGWVLISIWTSLTGGHFTFGSSLNSGRVLMLLLHIGSSILLYLITKKSAKSSFAGIIAILIFSLSPLGVYFQRRVLLDNIMTFWLLASLYLIIKDNLKLRYTFLSGIFFAIAVLSKENAIFTLPAFVYGLYLYSPKGIKKFAISIWLTVAGSLTSFYAVFAIIKNELFPAANNEHVSLLGTLKFQSSRGIKAHFWQPISDFYRNFSEWLDRDSYLIILGIICLLFTIILAIKYKRLRVPVGVSCLLIFFLLRGGLVINFYIVPIIPFLGLSIGITIDFLIKSISKIYLRILLYISVVVTILLFSLSSSGFKQLYSFNETRPQIDTIKWIKDNLNEDDKIIVDGYSYVDLHDKFYNEKIFINADWFWKVEEDPEIRDVKFKNDWHNADYVMLSHEMAHQMRYGGHKLLTDAITHSTPIKFFASRDNRNPDITEEEDVFFNTDSILILKVDKEE